MVTPRIKVYWHNPAPIFVARVNMASVTYPVQQLTFDGVTVGSYTDVEPDMFFALGSAEGLDDYGRGRVRNVATATMLKVGRSSQGFGDGELDVEDNAWIHVYPDWRVHSKLPYQNPMTGVLYKDYDIPVGDHWEKPDPIANAGPGYARTIEPDTGTITVFLPGSTSIPVADGATIVSWLWDVKDCTILFGGTNTDDDIFIECPPGFRFIKLTATDSNGKSHVTRVPILADDPANSLCVEGMQVTNYTDNKQGRSMTMRTLVDLPRADCPDGALVMAFEDYDEASGLAPDPADRYHMLFIGWAENENASGQATETAWLRNTTLLCVDVMGRLDRLPGFPLMIELPFEDDPITWASMASPNMDKYIAHIITDHSTAAGVADLFLSGTGEDYAFVSFDSAGSSLYEQVQRQANRMVPDHNFTCNEHGQLRVIVDPNLQNPADRTSTVQGAFTAQWIQGMQFAYQRTPRVNTLRASALLVQTEWLTEEDDDDVLLFAYSIAPGTSPGQGVQEMTLGERLAKSQQDLNDCVGHHYARINARYGLITIEAALGDAQGISPANMTWVQLLTTESIAPQRGLDFDTIRCLAKEVSTDFSYPDTGRVARARITLEPETVGLPALTDVPAEALPVGETPPVTVPPEMGLREGVEKVAGVGLDGKLYRTFDFQTDSGSGGPTWAQVNLSISETIYSFVVDPFSPGYINHTGTGAINGWIATEDAIYRITDMFGTTAVDAVLTFATTADASAFHWRTIQASFGAYFAAGANPWLLCISYYGATSGHTGTWARRSVDGGVTWSAEVQISADYDTSIGITRFNPIGVYTSPKTPGLAYTAAYTATEPSPMADGYVSVDWGETWTRLSADPVDDPAEPLPLWAVRNDAGVLSVGGPSARGALKTVAASGSGLVSMGEYLIVAPPSNAVRIVVNYFWYATFTQTGSSNASSSQTVQNSSSGNTHTGTDDYVQPAANSFSFGGYAVQWTKTSGTSWPVNRTSIISSPPATPNGARINQQIAVNAISAHAISLTVQLIGTVTEIELSNGHIYVPPVAGPGFIQPGEAFSGTIHLPWPDNADEQLAYYGAFANGATREFRLSQSVGGVITDISPTDGSIVYGVNRGSFGIRSFDNNRQYLLASVIGNDTSADPADDMHAIYASVDEGATWSEVVAAVPDSDAPSGRPAFEAAYGGDSEDIMFTWGTANYIGYSDDGGATVDSRGGNLSSFGSIYLVGIAGGPIG